MLRRLATSISAAKAGPSPRFGSHLAVESAEMIMVSSARTLPFPNFLAFREQLEFGPRPRRRRFAERLKIQWIGRKC